MGVRIHCAPVCAGICECVLSAHVAVWEWVVCVLECLLIDHPGKRPGPLDRGGCLRANVPGPFIAFAFTLNLNMAQPLATPTSVDLPHVDAASLHPS